MYPSLKPLMACDIGFWALGSHRGLRSIAKGLFNRLLGLDVEECDSMDCPGEKGRMAMENDFCYDTCFGGFPSR